MRDPAWLLQIAAVAHPAFPAPPPQDCFGYAPRYSDAQRQELRVALSAAAQILQRWAAAGAFCCSAISGGAGFKSREGGLVLLLQMGLVLCRDSGPQ